MIKTLDKSGRTEEEAVALALAELGMDRDDVSVEILERAKSGFLGIGACPAVVRVTYELPDPVVEAPKPQPKKEQPKPAEPKPQANKKPEQPKTPAKQPKPQPKKEQPKPAEPKKEQPKPVEKTPVEPVDESEEYARIRSFLKGLLEHMDVDADIEISARENGGVNVNLTGDGMGAIIGRRGETLDAIQHLTNYAVNHGSDKHMHISVDAECYRSKREEALIKLAEKMAEKAIKYKRSMTLEPMNSYERHVIHTALQNYEGVTTSSTGVEPNRRVVVSYVRPQSSNKPQSREWA